MALSNLSSLFRFRRGGSRWNSSWSGWSRRGSGSSNRSFLGDVGLRLFGLMTWIPVVVLFNNNVAEVTTIHGPSMYPFFNEDYDRTLMPNVVLNYRWDPPSNLQRGMVVTFRSPYNPETVAVKRIVALEGDEVVTKAPAAQAVVQVPRGHIWVEGDGPRDKTLDSNTYGPISAMLVTGRITHILYPFERFGPVKWWEHRVRG